MSNIKWQSEKCPGGGILEICGDLFLSLKCTKRCDQFRDKECDVEKRLDISALTPLDKVAETASDSVCCFNEKLLDYGELEDFDGLLSAYSLTPQETGGKTYFLADTDQWLEMLKKDRKLMFAVFAHTQISIREQHKLIFSGAKWVELIEADPDFYLDYRLIKQDSPDLQLEKWPQLCMEHRKLYAYLKEDREYDFNDWELTVLLGRYPDLDDEAYEQLKRKAKENLLKARNGSMTAGAMWRQLLLSGYEKFWKDCASCNGFDSLSGKQWMELLDDGKVGGKALAEFNSDKSYSYRFSDSEWDEIAKKSYYGKLKHRPRATAFVPFFLSAPRRAAKCQFKWLAVISVVGTVVGNLFMALLGGITLWPLMVTGVIWSVVLAAWFSRIAVRRTRAVIWHGGLIGITCGVLLPLADFLLFSLCNQSEVRSVLFLSLFIAAFSILYFIATRTFFLPVKENSTRRADFSWLFYAIFALMLAFCATCFWTPNKNKKFYDSCTALQMRKSLQKFFLSGYLRDKNYWKKWEEACRKSDKVAALADLIGDWRPNPEFFEEEYGKAQKQLMDALLEESEQGKASLGELVKQQKFMDNAAQEHILGKLREAKNNNASAEKIVAYLKVVKYHGVKMDEPLRNELCDFAAGQNSLEKMKLVYDQLDRYPASRKQLAKMIADKVRNNGFLAVKTKEDIRILLDLTPQDNDFWKALLVKLVKEKDPLHPAACALVEEKIPAFKGLVEESRKEFKDNVTREETDKFESLIAKHDDLKKFEEFLKNSKYLDIKELGYRNDYRFWCGRLLRKSDPAADWQKCFEAFLQPDKFRFENTRKNARVLRCEFAELLAKQENGTAKALQLWKACLKDGSRTREQTNQAYCGIFNFEQDPGEFRKYFFEAARNGIAPGSLYDNLIPPEVKAKVEKIKPGTTDEKLEIAKYHLSEGNYRKAREYFDDREVFSKWENTPKDGETLYKLALIEPALVEDLKRRLGTKDPALNKIDAKFNSAMEYACSKDGMKSSSYVQKASAMNYPEAMFLECVYNYYASNKPPYELDKFESELRRCKQNLRQNHPKSEYIDYLDKLGEAAGAKD